MINGYILMALVSVASYLGYYVTSRVSSRLVSTKEVIKEEMVQANNEVMEKMDSVNKVKLVEFEEFWQEKLAEIRDIDNIKSKLNRDFTGSLILLVSCFLFAMMDIFSTKSIATFSGIIIYPIHASCIFLITSCCIYLYKIRTYGKYTRAPDKQTKDLKEDTDKPLQDPLQEVPVETYEAPMQ